MKEDYTHDLNALVRRAHRIQEAMRQRGISTNLTAEEARMVSLPANVFYESDPPKVENKAPDGEKQG
jgi:hypothetical protein